MLILLIVKSLQVTEVKQAVSSQRLDEIMMDHYETIGN